MLPPPSSSHSRRIVSSLQGCRHARPAPPLHCSVRHLSSVTIKYTSDLPRLIGDTGHPPPLGQTHRVAWRTQEGGVGGRETASVPSVAAGRPVSSGAWRSGETAGAGLGPHAGDALTLKSTCCSSGIHRLTPHHGATLAGSDPVLPPPLGCLPGWATRRSPGRVTRPRARQAPSGAAQAPSSLVKVPSASRNRTLPLQRLNREDVFHCH